MYQKNVANQYLGFLLATCCGAPVTGATVTAKRSIDGGSQANVTGTVSELGNGQYSLDMSAADTNGDAISFLFTATGAVPVEKNIETSDVSTVGGGAYLGVPPPILMAGKALLPPHLSQFNSNPFTMVAARYYTVPIYVPRATTFAGAKAWNSGSGDNGKKIKIAVYNESASGGPGTLAKDFGEVTLSGASAVRTFASSWSAAGPAWYYLSLVSDSNPAMYGCTPAVSVTSSGYVGDTFEARMLPAFAADVLSTSGNVKYYHGDYVDGTYANFPESTSLTPTNSVFGVAGTSATIFPLALLYK